MDLFVWQISEASSIINPFETPRSNGSNVTVWGQKRNCWWLKLPTNFQDSVTSHAPGTAIGSWIEPETSEKKAPPILLRLDASDCRDVNNMLLKLLNVFIQTEKCICLNLKMVRRGWRQEECFLSAAFWEITKSTGERQLPLRWQNTHKFQPNCFTNSGNIIPVLRLRRNIEVSFKWRYSITAGWSCK